MRCQIEVGTPVCRSVDEARNELAYLRTAVSEVARQHDLAIIASSTHPFATWLPPRRAAPPAPRSSRSPSSAARNRPSTTADRTVSARLSGAAARPRQPTPSPSILPARNRAPPPPPPPTGRTSR